MKLYSRNFYNKFINIPEGAVVRINLAWYRDKMSIPNGYDLFFDYPAHRRKPPIPELNLGQAIELAASFKRTRYFAISNASCGGDMEYLRGQVPSRIKIVPKIETKDGVDNLYDIVKCAETDLVMLDTEDLFLDTLDEYEDVLSDFNSKVRFGTFYTDELKLKVLRLQGVVFCDY